MKMYLFDVGYFLSKFQIPLSQIITENVTHFFLTQYLDLIKMLAIATTKKNKWIQCLADPTIFFKKLTSIECWVY